MITVSLFSELIKLIIPLSANQSFKFRYRGNDVYIRLHHLWKTCTVYYGEKYFMDIKVHMNFHTDFQS